MIPNITRGNRPRGLVVYLVGDGRANEHENPHMVAGEIDLLMQYSGRTLTLSDVDGIAQMLDESRLLMGTDVTRIRRSADKSTGVVLESRVAADVWHCSLSLSSTEGVLSDEKWAAITNEFMDTMGFTSTSGRSEAKWVAIRHGVSKNGNDHVHIAASMVRTDGTKVNVHNDFKRAQTAARDLEVKHGLAITGDRAAELGTRGLAPADYTAAHRAETPVEAEATKLARMVRAAAATSEGEAEFVRRVRRQGVLIRPRFAVGADDVVVGYSVALRRKDSSTLVWRGGGKLARDLTLPRLRADWEDTLEGAEAASAEWQAAYRGDPMVAPGREATEPNPELWQSYTEDIRALRERLSAVPLDDRAGWATAAKDTAGVFAAWSTRIECEPGPLALVSAELARTAQLRAHQVRPRQTASISAASTALILVSSTLGADSLTAQIALFRQLSQLADSMQKMLAARGDLAQAIDRRDFVHDQLTLVAHSMQQPVSATPDAAAVASLGRATAPIAAPPAQRPGPTFLPPEAPPQGRPTELDR